MPFTNSDKITTNELSDEVASRLGIPITRSEWEAKIESGEITPQTTTMYYITDDDAQSTTEEIAESVLQRLGTLDIYEFRSQKNATNGNAKLGLKSIYSETGTDYNITGTGTISVTSDSNGNISISNSLPSSGVVTGVKGDKESVYRDNNVNITPANIGALPDTTLYAGSSTAGGIATEAAKTSGAITFTGAVTGDYDGSTDKTVNIPKLYSTTGENTDGSITQSAISGIITGLVDTSTGSPAVSKTITAFDQVDGKVTATFADIAISKAQAGLANVENKSSETIRSEITSSNVTTALGFTPADAALIGAANGIATLDANGLIPSALIPGSYDEVLYYNSTSDFPASGDTTKIYIAKDTNIQYRWGGESYVAIGSHLALGETSSTAYRGDRGKTAYDHATETKSGVQASGLYKFAVTSGGHIASVTEIQKTDITALGIPAQDTTYTGSDGITLTNGNFTNSGVRSIATGRNEDANGTIAVNTGGTVAAVAVKGLGTAAFTASTAYATAAQGTTADSAVQSVKITGDSTEYKAGTNVVLPAYPTSLPASDVSAWAKAANKPTYTASEVGAASASHTHTASIASTTDTNELSLVANTKYKLTAGGSTFVFTTPTDTTYQSKAATSGGTDVSLVTTGEKYTWNNKSNLAIGTTATTAAAGNHTHTTTLAADSGTPTVQLVANTVYKITAGGSSVIFKTAPDTTYSSKAAASGGTDVSLVTTGEKYTWNNKSDLKIGTTGSTAAAGNHAHSASLAADSGTPTINLAANTVYKITAGGGSIIFKTPVDNNTTYSSKVAASGGTDVSLVTTGEKYIWNNKSSLTIGTTATTAAAGNHTHTASIASSSGTNQLTLAASTKYVLNAGGSSFIFTTPPNTTYSSKAAASGGTDVSLVTTGEKATWNAKSNLTIGTTATTAAAGNHTHSASIASSSGTNQLTLAANTKYELTAGGSKFVFTTPPDTNTWRPIGTGATDAAAGNHTHDYSGTYAPKSHTHTKSQITDFPSSMPASDVYSWAKASTKPTYTASEVGAAPASHTHNYAGSASAGGPATNVVGTYSGNGGQLTPSAVANATVRFAMMNNPKGVTGFPTYADCILMDTYSGSDVPWTTGLGIIKQDAAPRMFLFNGAKGNTTTWKNINEVLTTSNYSSYAAAKSHGNHVPTIQTANNAIFLRNDNTWATVTPANIGAAASSHTHTVSQITDLPTISESATGSTIVKRNSSGYIFATYLNQSSGAETPTTSSYIMYCNSDGYLRKSTLANIASKLGIPSKYAGSSSAGGSASNANYANSSLTSTASTQCLRNLASGTAAATTSNCPTGSWYGQHS